MAKKGDGVWPYGNGKWAFAVRLETSTGRFLLKRGGFKRAGEKHGLDLNTAHGARNHVVALLRLVKENDPRRKKLGDQIVACKVKDGRLDLPDLEETQRRISARVNLSAPAMAMGAWLDRWLKDNRDIVETTRQGHAGCIERYLRPHLGDVPLEDLTADHINDMLNWIEKHRSLSPGSVYQVFSVLRAALNEAKRRQLIAFNPCDQVKLPKVVTTDRSVWTVDEAAHFLAVTDDRYVLAYRVIIITGLRRGEACGLKWSDINWNTGKLRVQRQLVNLDHRWQATTTKTGRSRTVSLDAETIELLRQLAERQRDEYEAKPDVYANEGWVFAKEDGTHVDPKMLSWNFQQLARQASLPVIHLHDLRHLSATLDLLLGTDVKIVSKRLGHARTGITQNLYQHVLDGMQEQAAEGRPPCWRTRPESARLARDPCGCHHLKRVSRLAGLLFLLFPAT